MEIQIQDISFCPYHNYNISIFYHYNNLKYQLVENIFSLIKIPVICNLIFQINRHLFVFFRTKTRRFCSQIIIT